MKPDAARAQTDPDSHLVTTAALRWHTTLYKRLGDRRTARDRTQMRLRRDVERAGYETSDHTT